MPWRGLAVQIIQGQSYNFSYSYNLADALTSEAYPSGRVVTTGQDGANRPNAVTGTLNGQQTSYVSNVSYAPQGAPTYYSYGSNLWPGTTFNSRCSRPRFTGH